MYTNKYIPYVDWYDENTDEFIKRTTPTYCFLDSFCDFAQDNLIESLDKEFVVIKNIKTDIDIDIDGLFLKTSEEIINYLNNFAEKIRYFKIPKLNISNKNIKLCFENYDMIYTKNEIICVTYQQLKKLKLIYNTEIFGDLTSEEILNSLN